MSSRRDNLYKQLFSHPEIVRDLVAGFLSADWAQSLTVDAFERVNASYASDHGQARHADVVWRARIGGEWVYVYILLEFQSRPDKWMALRMQVYVGLLYQDLVAQHKLSKHGKLPPVLPIVLYHGRRPWTAVVELADLMLPPPAGLERFQASHQYLLIDQHHDGKRGDIVSLLLRVLQSRTESELRLSARALTQRIQQADFASARASLGRWLQLTLQDEFNAANMIPEEDLVMNARRKFNFYEVFTDEFFEDLLRPGKEARQEGKLEGIQQGMQQGMQQGTRQTLQHLLNDVLLAEHMPADQVAAILAADNSQLSAWIKALAGGASPRQLFAEGGSRT
jgi:predicted transposase/invertase (TIGR01784 family)